MDHFERLQATIQGRKTDRPPYSMWMHFHVSDRSPYSLAEATNRLYENYDMDLIKITPSGQFMNQDYGVSLKFGREEWEHPLPLDNILKTKDDLLDLKDVDLSTGALRRELDQVALTVAKINHRSPVLMTCFSPLTVITKMMGNANIPALLQYYMDNYPEELHFALRKVSKMIFTFIDGCIERGVDGFFFATQCANYQYLRNTDQYKEFGYAYDYPITEKIHKAGKICMLHVCMHNVMLEQIKNLPVDIVNWDNIYSGTSITQAREILPDKVLAAGIDIFKINDWTNLADVDAMIERALKEAGNEKFMLAPTCVLVANCPARNLKEIRSYMSGLSK